MDGAARGRADTRISLRRDSNILASRFTTALAFFFWRGRTCHNRIGCGVVCVVAGVTSGHFRGFWGLRPVVFVGYNIQWLRTRRSAVRLCPGAPHSKVFTDQLTLSATGLTANLTARGFKMASVWRAVSRCISSRTCPYVFMVSVIEEWPKSSMMYRA